MYNLPLFFQEMNERGKKEGPEWGKVVASCVGCLDKKKVPIRLNRHFSYYCSSKLGSALT
jgi:hypothetical protein